MEFLGQFRKRLRERFTKARQQLAEIEVELALEEQRTHSSRWPKRGRSTKENLIYWAVITLLSWLLWSLVKSHN